MTCKKQQNGKEWDKNSTSNKKEKTIAALTPEFPTTKQDTTDHSAQDILHSEQTRAQWSV